METNENQKNSFENNVNEVKAEVNNNDQEETLDKIDENELKIENIGDEKNDNINNKHEAPDSEAMQLRKRIRLAPDMSVVLKRNIDPHAFNADLFSIQIWKKILDYLPFMDIAYRLGRTSKSVRSVCYNKDCWSSVDCSPMKSILHNTHIKNLTPVWVNIVKLNLFECNLVNDKGLYYVGQHLKSLQDLNLCGCTSTSDHGLQSIGAGCNDLRRLDLTCCVNVTDVGINSICNGCPNIQVLNLWGCSQVSDVGMAYIGRLSNLEDLNLTWCRGIGEVGMNCITSCTKLCILNCMWCEKIRDSSMKYIAKLGNLRVLILDGCSRVTDHGIKHLATYLKHLEFIACRFLTKVTIVSVQWILAYCLKIKRIDIRYCDLVVKEHIKTFVERFPGKKLVY